MILGERIKRIRTFRRLTQRELGLKLGYEERNADVRVAQYESGYRVPKKDTLMEIARILNVNYINFIIFQFVNIHILPIILVLFYHTLFIYPHHKI